MDFREAARALKAAMARGEGGVEAHLRLAALHLQLLEPRAAAQAIEAALAIEPLNGDAHSHLGLARFEEADLAGAVESFAKAYILSRGALWRDDPLGALAQPPLPSFPDLEMAVNRVKIAHDCEQLEYLLRLQRVPQRFSEVAADYRALLAELPDSSEQMSGFDAARHPLVARCYKRPLHLDPGALPSPAPLNAGQDYAQAEARYLEATPNMVVVDELLSPEALGALRRFCLESTVWNEIKPGYLGAYLQDGFAPPVLLHIAAELRARLPRIIRGLPLQMLWGYKYDSSLPGVGIGWHADAAAVNVNFWITPDEANLDAEHGGLLVYPVRAPADWNFTEFNIDTLAILDHIEATGGAPVRVPYRANRAVIFDSDLFHATDTPSFRAGYANRRINITLLYGARGA